MGEADMKDPIAVEKKNEKGGRGTGTGKEMR